MGFAGRPRHALAALSLLALCACGGAPSGTASTGAVHLPPPGEPAEVADAPASTRRGVAIVALGAVGTAENPDGGPVLDASLALARVAYQNKKLRPNADEATVQVLAGKPAPKDDPKLAELAELRAALPAELDTVTAKALLEGLARKVEARGMVLVSVGAEDARATARVVRVDELDGKLEVRLDPALFTASAPTAESPTYTWSSVDTALVALMGTSEVGPRRDPKATPPAPKPPDESTSIASKPWFWVIIGGVAALGLTAVIVSQTVDTSSGNVHLQGKVLP